MSPRIPRRSLRLHEEHLAAFEPARGEASNITHFKGQIYEMLKPACHDDNDPEIVSSTLALMCLKAQEICSKKTTDAYPLIEPILNVVQSQYSNMDDEIARKARVHVTSALRFVRVADQVSATTLLDSNLLDIAGVGKGLDISNTRTTMALKGWVGAHADKSEQFSEIERDIDERLAEIDLENDLYAEDKVALYNEWQLILRLPKP